MKKTVCVLLAVLLSVLVFAGCAGDTGKDSDYVIKKGKLIVGITDFAPMDYTDESGKWIGFDADLAAEFAKSLGVDVEFVEIEWDSKVMELDGKSIDCVWNGMTLNDGVLSAMECSVPYMNNQQIVVVPKANADKYNTVEACKDLKFAVEDGSAGKDMAVENGFTFTAVDKQSTAVMEVAAGTSEAAIIDSLMAGAMIGEGTGYADLTYTVALSSEQYGVGFRKGSDLVVKLNTFFENAKADGTMEKIAKQYGVHEALIK